MQRRYGMIHLLGGLLGLLLLCHGACAPVVPGGGGGVPDGSLRFLPDPEVSADVLDAADTPTQEPNTQPDNTTKDTPSTREPLAPDTGAEQTPDKTKEGRDEPDASTPEQPLPELPPEPSKPLKSWVGGPCQANGDCDYQDGVCLISTAGYPSGMCSLPCTRLCPDKANEPGTFCLELKGKITGDGGCVSRCDHQRFPGTGCRKGYHCASKDRFNEPQNQATVCIPGQAPPPPTGSCYQQLTKEGISFTPRTNPMAKPQGHPNLTCSVVDAVNVHPPIHGVNWVTGANKPADMFMRCSLALALSKFSRYLKSRGITKAMHYGTYSCRTIRNDSGSTNTLSQHGLGYAIDLAAFWDASGKEYNLVKHWDHSTVWKQGGQTGCHSTKFNSPEAKMLYEIGCAMWKQKIFTLVLTPNFNKVHDNHFHVDMSGSGSILSLPASDIRKHSGH